MKHTLFAVATGLTLMISLSSLAQPEPGRLRAPGPPPERRPESLRQVQSFNGQAGEWRTNDDYVYDGFYLQANQVKYLVGFPPHLGTQLTKLIKSGATVTVNGVEQENPEGQKEIKMVSIVANGQTIMDAPPAKRPETGNDEQVTGSGKLTALQKNREGEVNGYMVDNKVILRVPPHVINQLNALLTTGAAVSYTGLRKSTDNGEVSNGNISIVHCQTITVNGTQYLTR